MGKENNFEELKKSFIVNREEYQKEKLPDFISRALGFCTVDSEGGIHINNFSLTVRDKIVVALIARFLAHQLQSTIDSSMTGEEISTILDIDKAVTFARLKDLCDTKMVRRIEKGIYEIVPFYVEPLLTELQSKYQVKDEVPKSTKKGQIKKQSPQKNYKVTNKGISKDFLAQINKINKADYTFIYELPKISFKILGVLYMTHKELDNEWLASAEILKIFSEKFRIKTAWSTVSDSLKNLDKKAYVESRRKEGHSTAREYRIMKSGEDVLLDEKNKLGDKK